MANYTFKGQVKVSDVQAAFDDFVNRINTMVSTYNSTSTAIESMDLSIGAPKLAAAGYTLTVGGIKQLLEAYDGTLIGCRAFRVDSTHVAITDGMYLTKDGPIKIDAQVLTGDGFDIYFDPDENKVGLVNDNSMPENAFIISQLSNVAGDKYLTEFRNVKLEGLKDYKIVINKRSLSWGIEGDDIGNPRFQGSCVYYVNSNGADAIYFANAGVIAQGYAYQGAAYRAHASAGPANFLFIPKGCPSPIIVTGGNHTSRTSYLFELRKPTS